MRHILYIIMSHCRPYSLLAAVVVVIVWKLNLQLPEQVVHITINIVSSNPTHDEVNSIKHVIMFVSSLRLVGGFLYQ